MNFYGKPYISRGLLKCRMCFHISFGIEKNGFRKFGYERFWYDGNYHMFYLWPFILRWHYLPEIVEEDEN